MPPWPCCKSRLARIQAGEDEPDAAAVDGHVLLHGATPSANTARRTLQKEIADYHANAEARALAAEQAAAAKAAMVNSKRPTPT